MKNGKCLLLLLGLLALSATAARADYLYQWDTPVGNVGNGQLGDGYQEFNNSLGNESEDTWVANAFTVVAGGEDIKSISFLTGDSYTNRAMTAVIYTGQSTTNPQAGSGLQRIVATTTTLPVTADPGTWVTIPLANDVVLPVGQVFYAALLADAVGGGTSDMLFAEENSGSGGTPLNDMTHSFYDVAAPFGTVNAYNLDNTQTATVLGGVNPTEGGSPENVMYYGTLVERVNAVAVPEPASLALLTAFGAIAAGLAFARRRQGGDCANP